MSRYRTGHKRRYTPSAYDRVQDRKIRKLSKTIEPKNLTIAQVTLTRTAAQGDWTINASNGPAIAATDTVNSREGNEIVVQSLFVRGIITSKGTAAEIGGAAVRIVIGMQKVTDQSAPAALDIFHTDTILGMMSIQNTGTNLIDHSGNIQIFYDRTFNLDNNKSQQQVKFFKKWPRGLKQKYGSGTADFPHTNGFFICMCKRATTDGYDFQFIERVRFTG